MTYKIKCYLLIYIILFNNITVCAYGIVPSDATETKVYESRNNKTPIIEIAEPNDKGVSLNKYEDYNVDQRNLVINNSVSPVISKFAGAIDKNSNFNSGIEAEIIVNEVVSDKITELNGYTEIAGKKAELIIANPNGIITKEAGFINTSRLSLIVGRNTDIDKLEFEIDKKNELIVENDLDLAKVDSVTLIARIVKLRKEITAKSLRVQTGNNKATKLNNGEYDVTSRENISDKPTLSIDVSAFANIQAGKIYIVSTEEGVGVRMDSNLTTNVDDIIFETKGDIEINKDIVSENNVSMKTTKKLNNRGAVIAKNKNIEIEANAAENNNALMYAKSGDISITSKRLDNLQKSDIKTANGNIKLRVDTLNNIGTRNQEIREGEGYSVSRYKNYRMKKEEEARQRYLENRNKNNFQRLWGWGLLFLGNFYSPYSDSNPNAMQDQVLVHLTHSPSNITANGNIEIISNTVTNRDSNITASKDINITADTLNNSRESFVVGGLKKEVEIIEHYWEYPWGWGWCKGFGRKRYRTRHDPVDIPPQTHHSNTPSLIAAGRNIKLNVKKKLGQDDDIKNKTNYSPIETNRPLPDLNNNHFIIKSRDPSYMFEIRPEFLDLSVFEARKDYETEIKLPEDVMFLGDSFVENEYIKDQLELQKETNKTILTNQNQLNSRIQELILNGIEYARLHKDQISYQLNEKQIKELEKDMIHYERRIINDIEVLVPRIYYASIDRAFESLIKAENELEINGETEIVNSGNLEGNNISVSTTGNFINKAGTIRSNKNIKIKSKNIVNRSITNRYGNNNNITEEFVGEGIIQSDNGNITLESDNNIINIGSTIDSKTGELKLIAGDGISITTQQLHNKVDQGEIYKRETLTNISSNVFTKDLVIKSKKDTSIIGSNINVSNNANIESKTLTISSVENLTYEHTKKEEYSFWKGSKTTTTDTTIVTNLKSNLNIGNNLTINTEQDTNIIGSNIDVKKDININTENGDVNIMNVKDMVDTVTTIKEEGGFLDRLTAATVGAVASVGTAAAIVASGAATGGVGALAVAGAAGALINIGSVTSKEVKKTDKDETIVSSNINSSRLTINSGTKKDINIRSSVIPEKDNITINYGNLNIYNDTEEKHIHKEEVIGDEIGIGSIIGTAALTGLISGHLSALTTSIIASGNVEKIVEMVASVGAAATTLTIQYICNEKDKEKKEKEERGKEEERRMEREMKRLEQSYIDFKEEQKIKREEMIAKTQKTIENKINELDYRIMEKRAELITNPDMSIEERNNINQEINEMENERRMSEEGIEMLKTLEGRELSKTYKCEAGKDTIGYGHVVTPQERELYKDGITEEQALELLEKDIKRVSRGFNYITTDLNQQQYDALSMFFFNLGPDILKGTKTLDLINGTPRPGVEYKTLEDEFKDFKKFRKPDGGYGESDGLENRRNMEWNLFEKGEYCFGNQCFKNMKNK